MVYLWLWQRIPFVDKTAVFLPVKTLLLTPPVYPLVCKFYTLAIVYSYAFHVTAYSIVAVVSYQFLLQYWPPLLEFYSIPNTLEPLVHRLHLRPHLLWVGLMPTLPPFPCLDTVIGKSQKVKGNTFPPPFCALCHAFRPNSIILLFSSDTFILNFSTF